MNHADETFEKRRQDAQTIALMRENFRVVIEYVRQMEACDDRELLRSFTRALKRFVNRVSQQMNEYGDEGKPKEEGSNAV